MLFLQKIGGRAYNGLRENDQSSLRHNEQEKLDWLRLNRTSQIGPVTFYRLIEKFGSARAALDALPEFSRASGRKNPLTPFPKGAAEKELSRLRQWGGDIMIAGDENYPLALAATEDAPPVLSYRGNPELVHSPCLAMVGARNASLNGCKFARRLARELGAGGQIVVSGLARGIDTAAHEGALESGTIAVVAGGIDVVYPRENKKLFDQIAEQGLILAESPFGTQPVARHFPKRNRIVSGLSAGVIVVEATIRSGSLITARMAAEQGRDVYAVPGFPADPRAAGPNMLIRDGATLVREADDILEALSNFSGGRPAPVSSPHPPTPQFDFSTPEEVETPTMEPVESNSGRRENAIPDLKDELLARLSGEPIDIDELSRTCHVSIPALQEALLELELAGNVKRLPGNRIARINEGL